ncbi:hypothetical protein LMG29542_08080 [Paraburkholderia humisilvae]|uniref:Uncharacterized protein n=1 Tax=Paraburkholderia humisilvae TaxID=627669 RepID=A0A6J5FAJ4_9BURK|nr:hypothetical protein LMG29542_08080 [Paraburkholderia humisilvae]
MDAMIGDQKRSLCRKTSLSEGRGEFVAALEDGHDAQFVLGATLNTRWLGAAWCASLPPALSLTVIDSLRLPQDACPLFVMAQRRWLAATQPQISIRPRRSFYCVRRVRDRSHVRIIRPNRRAVSLREALWTTQSAYDPAWPEAVIEAHGRRACNDQLIWHSIY